MNFNKTLGFTLIILMFFIRCSNNDDVSKNEIIIYQEGNVKIILIDVNDQRCPINVNCVWQGNAKVGMRIIKENQTMDFILHNAGEEFNFPSSVSIFDLNIELLDLEPNPEEGVSFSLEDYAVSIHVTN